MFLEPCNFFFTIIYISQSLFIQNNLMLFMYFLEFKTSSTFDMDLDAIL
jgi:hypothetical protein